MLWFLALAAKAGWLVDDYLDHAEGVMARNGRGKLAMTLSHPAPEVRMGGARCPTPSSLPSCTMRLMTPLHRQLGEQRGAL